MPAVPVAQREYVCPGERYAISRAVHLARMATGYSGCRECPLRSDAPGAVIEETGSGTRIPRTPFRRLFQTDGVRGVFRNELDPAKAERLATALAAMLWEDANAAPPASGFPVVVGYDDRPWSLPLAVSAAAALRRSGCETLEIGLTTGPEFRFAVAHLDAAAGILATGAGSGPAFAGLDFTLAGGRPLSAGGGLDRLAALGERPLGRMTRRACGRRAFDVSVAYEAGLRRHFRAFAPVTGVVACASSLVRGRLERISADLSATLKVISLPRRSKDGDAGAAGFEQLSRAVRESSADFGLWIDEDGTACRAIDESGRAVSVADLAGLLLSDALDDRPGSEVALDWSLADQLCGTALPREAVRGNGTIEAMARSMRDHTPVAGADSAGRFWLPGPPASADALVTLARVLRRLAGRSGVLSCRA